MQRGALLLVCCACLRAQTAAIEGVVVNQTSGEPMAGVHVRLNSVTSSAEGQPYGAISNRAGHFSIASLPAGTYIAQAELRGFFYMPPKGGGAVPRVSLKAGQQISDFKIEMAQSATISGRVVDDYGDPAQANIHVESETERAMNYGRFGNSDERGEFHISVAPGKYYIVAEPGGGRNPELEIRTDATADARYGKTYYPGSAVQAKAVIVEAGAGAELTGIDIHLARQPRGLSISGMVSGGAEAPGGSLVMLQQGDDQRHMGLVSNTGTDRSNHFAFPELQPGAYRLFALHSFDKTRLYSQPVDVHLGGGDVTGVNLVLAPGGEITGKLEMAGGLGAEKVSVSLEGMAAGFFGGSNPSAEVDQTGGFRIADIAPGRYRVKVAPTPENAYLKSVRLDGAEAPGGELDLSRGAQGSLLRIVVSPNGGQVEGKLLDKDGEPVGAVPVMTLLVADPKDIDLERSLKVVEEGAYRFQGIRPGKYRLLAFDRFLLADVPESSEMIKKLAAAAEEIEIKEGDRKVKDLKLLVKEDADAKPRQ
jgi:hypothetical protein